MQNGSSIVNLQSTDDMIYVLTVYATFGVILTVPTVYSSYEQCMYHAEKIEEQRRWTMHSPTITAKCDVK